MKGTRELKATVWFDDGFIWLLLLLQFPTLEVSFSCFTDVQPPISTFGGRLVFCAFKCLFALQGRKNLHSLGRWMQECLNQQEKSVWRSDLTKLWIKIYVATPCTGAGYQSAVFSRFLMQWVHAKRESGRRDFYRNE